MNFLNPVISSITSIISAMSIASVMSAIYVIFYTSADHLIRIYLSESMTNFKRAF